jgi:two-component system sensor histidine kinase/response regulator
LGGDESLFRKLLSMFLDDVPMQIGKMQQHLKDEDFAGVQMRAHALKGVTMSIGGKAMQEVTSEIEVAATNGELARARGPIPRLQKEFERLKYSIRSAAIFLKFAKRAPSRKREINEFGQFFL